jgi:hypothetical protein
MLVTQEEEGEVISPEEVENGDCRQRKLMVFYK